MINNQASQFEACVCTPGPRPGKVLIFSFTSFSKTGHYMHLSWLHLVKIIFSKNFVLLLRESFSMIQYVKSFAAIKLKITRKSCNINSTDTPVFPCNLNQVLCRTCFQAPNQPCTWQNLCKKPKRQVTKRMMVIFKLNKVFYHFLKPLLIFWIQSLNQIG